MITDIISKHDYIFSKALNEKGLLTEIYDLELQYKSKQQIYQEKSYEEIELIISYLRNTIGKTYVSVEVLMLSFFVEISLSTDVFVLFLDYQLNEMEGIALETRIFVFQQTIALEFNKPSMVSKQSKILMWRIQQKLVEDYSISLKDQIIPIKKEERNKSVVVVVTDQLLGSRHSPTKNICDDIEIMIRKLGKKIVLINTAESLSLVGYTPMFSVYTPNYLDDYLKCDSLDWNGCKIPFFQCENNMPNLGVISVIINTIYKIKPEYIIINGPGVITGNILSKIVPAIAMPLSANIVYSSATFQSKQSQSNVVYELNEEEKSLLSEFGKTEDYLIPLHTIYQGMEKADSFKREEFGIPDDAFVCVVVGSRLDVELSDEFWEMVASVNEEKMLVLLVGGYQDKNLKKIRSIHKGLKVKNVGYIKNLSGLYVICDLYVNPKRVGGGFSASEALCEGVPVVSYNYGDVAANVGKQFCVETTEEMTSLIKKYINQEEFYKQMSDAAKEHASKCCDIETILKEHLEELEKRIDRLGL